MNNLAASARILTVPVSDLGDVSLTFDDRGSGHPVLLLHGGGGPQTVAGYAGQLAGEHPVRVLTPTHPGFGGTARPEALTGIAQLAALYGGLLAELDLADVTVIGNSIGGWIAAEMGLLDTSRIGRLVLVDAVGIEVPGHPVADFFSLSFAELAQYSYHDPAKFQIDPTALTVEAKTTMAANRASLATYAGTAMADPTLAHRLGRVSTPVLVVFGEADRIVDPDYGRAYAAAVPSAQFVLLPRTGHLPQLETPVALTDAVWTFVQETVGRQPADPAHDPNTAEEPK